MELGKRYKRVINSDSCPQGGDTPVVVLMRTKERDGVEGPIDMGSLNHMTHHSLPQQMVTLPFSQPQQQTSSLFQPPSQPPTLPVPATRHSPPPPQHSARHPEKDQCLRERSASTQSVEAMVCDEEETVIRPEPSERIQPVRPAWNEQVFTALFLF